MNGGCAQEDRRLACQAATSPLPSEPLFYFRVDDLQAQLPFAHPANTIYVGSAAESSISRMGGSIALV